MKNILLIITLTFLTLTSNAQKKIGGVEIPVKVNFNETNLELNGAGIREKFWIDLYVGALYIEKTTNNAVSIINDDKTMAIKLHIISSLITSKKMTDAVNEGFEKSTKGDQTAIKDEIAKFKAVFSTEIKNGDVYDIVYIPTKGTTVYKNNKPTATIAGLAFKKALFGIWFCNDPADSALKEAMLGK